MVINILKKSVDKDKAKIFLLVIDSSIYETVNLR